MCILGDCYSRLCSGSQLSEGGSDGGGAVHCHQLPPVLLQWEAGGSEAWETSKTIVCPG